MIERRGLCLVIAAASGTGKSSIVRRLLAQEVALSVSVSVTTRACRLGEIEGRDYFFRSIEDFETMIEAGELLEHARVFGRGYGTPRSPVESLLEQGRDVVLDIDWQGWRQLQAAFPKDSVGVFILPPSLQRLEQRLRSRGSDSDAEIARRMQAARDEIGHWAEFDHVLVNDDLTTCVAAVTSVLQAARCSVGRSIGAAALALSMISEAESAGAGSVAGG